MINPPNGHADRPQRTVLIVDDTPEDRHVYHRYLLKDAEWRYRVLEAGTGEEAVAMFREAQPDCILLDYRLPDINGLEVLAALAVECEGAICPVVALTAEEDVAVAVAALKAGAQDYLNKATLTPVDLIHAVNNAIERVALRRENERQRRALVEQNLKLEEALAAQKLLDEDLRASRERLTGIIESAMDAIITVDDRQRIVLFNAAAERMFGCPGAEAIGQPISRFIPEQARAAHESHIREFGQEGAPNRQMGALGAVSGKRARGDEFPIEASISQVEVAGQRLFTVILRDVTERKRAEEILKRYELLSELARDIVLLIRLRDGRVIEANHAAVAAYGYDRETLMKMSLFDLRAPGTMPDVATQMAKADAEGILFETKHQRKDGSVFPVEVSSNGADIGGERMLLSVIRDISERKRIEQERNLFLQREQHARRIAEDANRAKDEFLAVVTHELRSPLNAMLGYARIQCARPEIDLEEARRAFETIRRNGERQKALIDDLLDTARIITGKLRLDVGPVDLVAVINDAIETALPAAESKLILLTSKLAPNAGQVTGDDERLHQIVWNLLTNAVKFTPEGGRVEVTLERAGPRVTLTVSDTGQGIAPEFLPHIFDRFTQQDTSHSRRHSGLGLGLALVKQLVEMHGGDIKARSAGENQGATFTVNLPLRIADCGLRCGDDRECRRAGEPEMKESANRNTPSANLEGVRVLVGVDDEDARALVMKILEDSGAKVAPVGSAIEAFAMIIEPPQPDWPDVLVCDIGMPEEDGYSLMRRIREWEHGHGLHLPSVALTSLNRAEDRMKALEAGFKMHVAKPVEPEEMVAVVKSLASRGRRSESRRRKAPVD
ncbi:MAG: response regulator [Blastocatellales bacterium]